MVDVGTPQGSAEGCRPDRPADGARPDPPDADSEAGGNRQPAGMRSAVAMFLAQASIAVVNLPVTIVLARTLSTGGLGDYQFVNRLAMLAIAFAFLGYPHAVAWAAGAAADADERAAGLNRALARIALTGGFLFLAAVLAGRVLDLPIGTAAWLALAIYPLLNMSTAVVVSYHRGRLDVVSMAVVRVGQAVLWLLTVSALALAGELTVDTAVLSLAGCQLAALVLAGVQLTRRAELRRPQGDQAAVMAAATSKYATRAYASMTLRDLYLYLDQILIGLFLPHEALGLYVVAASMTMAMTLLATPLINTAQPIVQRGVAQGRGREVVVQSLAGTLVLVAVPAVVLASTSWFLIPFVYGEDFAGAAPIAVVLCLGAVADALGATLNGALLGLGRPGRSSLSVGTGLVVSLVALAVLLPTAGLLGAAVASVLGYAATCFTSLVLVASACNTGAGSLGRATLQSVPRVIPLVVRSVIKR